MDIRIYDNGGETIDRYTVVFPDGECLGIGESGNVPNGFCMHVGSIHETGAAAVTEGEHLGERVTYETLPKPVRLAIRAECESYYPTLNLEG